VEYCSSELQRLSDDDNVGNDDDGKSLSRSTVGNTVADRSLGHRLAGRFPRRLALRAAAAVRRLHRRVEGSL